jgi:hypothetical protein
MVNLLGRKGLGIGVDMLLEGRLVTDGRIDEGGGRSVMVFLAKRHASRVVIWIIIICVVKDGRGCCLSTLLGSDLLCSEEAATRASGTTHCVLVTTFVQIRLYEGELVRD